MRCLALLLAVAALLPAAYGRGPSGAGGKCPTGVQLTTEDVKQRTKNFYAHVVQRFGPDSPQAKAFIPKEELPAAKEAAGKLPASQSLSPAAVTDPAKAAELDRMTKAVEALKAPPGGAVPPEANAAGMTSIPTNFHIVMDKKGNGAVTDAQVQAQLDVLNQAYAFMGFQFVLNTTTRYTNQKWFVAKGQSKTNGKMKAATRLGDQSTLNVWTVRFTKKVSLFGYATFPDEYESYPSDDGVVLLYLTLPGVLDPPNEEYGLGDTLTHEVGHWMGLYHTFQGDPNNGCNAPGDEVDDTPFEESANYGCDETRDTCPDLPGTDPVRNFMDYSPDSCLNTFSNGQKSRCIQKWATYRMP